MMMYVVRLIQRGEQTYVLCRLESVYKGHFSVSDVPGKFFGERENDREKKKTE
mgnify:CR=1 FL=1